MKSAGFETKCFFFFFFTKFCESYLLRSTNYYSVEFLLDDIFEREMNQNSVIATLRC